VRDNRLIILENKIYRPAGLRENSQVVQTKPSGRFSFIERARKNLQPLLIPITDRESNPIPEIGNPDTKFYSANKTLLATGYTRIVVGKRGAYIEFSQENMCMENLYIPPDQKWRLSSDVAYYIEHRSRDAANVKVYEQRRTVGYADYKIDMFYIAPGDVVVETKG
jgi:hypothetical protein